MDPSTIVRFRYRRNAIHIVIEGVLEQVDPVRDRLGLSDVGYLQPIEGAQSTKSDSIDEEGVESPSSSSSSLPGPSPDPTKIPVVLHDIGSAVIDLRGTDFRSPPSISEIAQAFEKKPHPVAVADPLASDPVAESWLRLAFEVSHELGESSLSLDAMELIAGDNLARSGLGLEIWLEDLHRLGKLARVHRGGSVVYRARPAWMAAVKRAEQRPAHDS